MTSLFLFLHALFSSWLAWAGGIVRVIPYVETFLEPLFRRKAAIYEVLQKYGNVVKKDLKIIGLACLFVACFRAWSFEHKNAEVAMYGKDGKAEAWAKYNNCDKELLAKATLADALGSQVSGQQSQLAGQQDTFNKCMLALGIKALPGRPTIDVYQWKFPATYTYKEFGQIQFWVLVVTTNKSVVPLKGTLGCDSPFTHIDNMLLTHGDAMRASLKQTEPKSVHIEYIFPGLTPQSPLVVAAFTDPNTKLNQCSFTPD